MEDKRKLRFIFVAFALLLLLGTFGYMFLLRVSLVDALYMTVVTISTVGFGEVGKTSALSEIFSVLTLYQPRFIK